MERIRNYGVKIYGFGSFRRKCKVYSLITIDLSPFGNVSLISVFVIVNGTFYILVNENTSY